MGLCALLSSGQVQRGVWEEQRSLPDGVRRHSDLQGVQGSTEDAKRGETSLQLWQKQTLCVSLALHSSQKFRSELWIQQMKTSGLACCASLVVTFKLFMWHVANNPNNILACRLEWMSLEKLKCFYLHRTQRAYIFTAYYRTLNTDFTAEKI